MVEAKQYGERVNIVKYIRVEKKWRFAAVVEKRGRVIRDQVWIARRKEHHPEGRLLPRMVPRWEAAKTFGWRV